MVAAMSSAVTAPVPILIVAFCDWREGWLCRTVGVALVTPLVLLTPLLLTPLVLALLLLALLLLLLLA